MRKIEIFELIKKGNFMNKLFINLLLVLGINFSVFGSERESIYEEENAKAEDAALAINPLPFDRSNRRFAFVGSKEDLNVFWVVNGKPISEYEINTNPDYAQLSSHCSSATTYCFVNLGKKTQNQQSEQVENGSSVIIVHTKYNLDPNDSEAEEILDEASAYAQRVDKYTRLSKKERKKQMQKHLMSKHDRSEIPAYVDPNSSK